MKKMISVLASLLVLVFCLTACGQAAAESTEGQSLANGGVLRLSVNPEIAVNYDNDGNVTGVTARNDDALKILANYSGFQGKPAKTVVSELVTAIGEAGYFVEEIEGESRQITIEIEAGSALPSDTFLDDVINEVRNAVNSNNWQSPVEVKGESDYGITNYIDTDYGPNADGYTDYDTDYGVNNDGITDYDHSINDDSDYGPDNDGITDYDGTDYADNTDYGINADGNTDYNDSDYGIYGDGLTDYDHNSNDDTDYGPDNDGVTDYDGTNYADNTDYGVNADGDTDYNDTDYGPNNDGDTDYNDTDYGPNNDGVTDYDNGNTDYNGDTNYDDNDDDNTNYGDSDYDD